jgi:hypothetical protein
MFARQVLLKAAGPAGPDADLTVLRAALKIAMEKPEEYPRLIAEAKKLALRSAAAPPPPPGSRKTPNEKEEATS